MYTSLLYQELKSRHDMLFISFKKQYPTFLYPGKSDKDLISKDLVNIESHRLFNPLSPISWVYTYKKIKEFSPEIVVFTWWISFFAPSYFVLICFLRLMTKSEILFLCHNVMDHESNFIKSLFSKAALKKGDYFIVHSTKDFQNLEQFILKERIKKVFHPLYDVYNQTDLSKEGAKNRLSEKSGIILFFGFIREYKGLKYLIEAIAKLPSTFDAKLYIAGEFWEDHEKYSNLIEELKLHNRIVIKNAYIPNEDVEVYFKAADIVVLPYISATGSGIVQISYGFDKPVLVTEVGSLPEVVIEEKSGFIVPICDSEAIAKKLEEFYSSKDKNKFSKFIKEYKKNFTFGKIVDAIEGFKGNR
ncbi:glycosyltransferase [bacterium]|nr:glycosyltransferase [bacterium]